MKTADPDNTVCIVCHDAGGAEILACYAMEKGLRCSLALDGPAVNVFERHFGVIENHPLGEALAAADWCLFGTSWQSDLEWRALGEAKRLGKRTVSFLDHWVNYAERFVRGGEQRLPDEIWVGDEDARALAKQFFPALPVRVVPNPYFAYVEREIARYSRRAILTKSNGNALFVSENLSGHSRLRFGNERSLGYTEFDAIDYFFSRIGDLGEIGHVVLRPHPSDPPEKYLKVIAEHAPLAELSTGRALLEEIAEVDIVAGCESAALVVALQAHKRVVCCIPPGGEVQFINRRRGVEMLRELGPRAPATA